MEWKIANSQSYFYFVTLIFENKSKVSISITHFNVLTLQDLLGCMKIHFNLKTRGKDWSIPKTKGGIIMIASDLGLLFVTKTAHGFVTQDHGFGSLQLCQTLIIWREIFHTVQVDWFIFFFQNFWSISLGISKNEVWEKYVVLPKFKCSGNFFLELL